MLAAEACTIALGCQVSAGCRAEMILAALERKSGITSEEPDTYLRQKVHYSTDTSGVGQLNPYSHNVGNARKSALPHMTVSSLVAYSWHVRQACSHACPCHPCCVVFHPAVGLLGLMVLILSAPSEFAQPKAATGFGLHHHVPCPRSDPVAERTLAWNLPSKPLQQGSGMACVCWGSACNTNCSSLQVRRSWWTTRPEV